MSGEALGGKRATRKEIEEILDVLHSLGFEEHCQEYEVCGSYRRGKLDSGDVDIVIIPKASFADWFDNLKLKKRYGHFSNNILINGVQVDFFLCDKTSYPCAVMTWTGSRGFNMIMRGKCYKAGYVYTRHGIYDSKTKKLITGIITEFDIFNLISMKYVEPKDR